MTVICVCFVCHCGGRLAWHVCGDSYKLGLQAAATDVNNENERLIEMYLQVNKLSPQTGNLYPQIDRRIVPAIFGKYSRNDSSVDL